jgi:hypothetical protein
MICAQAQWANAQYWPDGVWMTAKTRYTGDTISTNPFRLKSANLLHFAPDTTFIDTLIVEVHMSNGVSTINNSSGNLFMYSHGYRIGNRYGGLVSGGENLFNIPGNSELSEWQILYLDYIHPQDCIILPDPNDSLLFHMIHQRHRYHTTRNDYLKCELHHTIVSMHDEDRRGVVLQSPVLVVNDSMIPGKITATRHANGKDWWIISRKASEVDNAILLFKLDESGLQLRSSTPTNAQPMHAIGDVRFSPDGKNLGLISRNLANVLHPVYHRLHLLPFDSENGTFGEETEILMPFVLKEIISKIEFSLNSRFLYFTDHYHLFQIDLQDPEFETVLIDAIEFYTTRGGYALNFGSTKISPLCHILSTSLGGIHILSSIEEPDAAGFASLPNQRVLPNNNLYMRDFPNTPHYLMGDELLDYCEERKARMRSVGADGSAMRRKYIAEGDVIPLTPEHALDLYGGVDMEQFRQEAIMYKNTDR